MCSKEEGGVRVQKPRLKIQMLFRATGGRSRRTRNGSFARENMCLLCGRRYRYRRRRLKRRFLSLSFFLPFLSLSLSLFSRHVMSCNITCYNCFNSVSPCNFTHLFSIHTLLSLICIFFAFRFIFPQDCVSSHIVLFTIFIISLNVFVARYYFFFFISDKNVFISLTLATLSKIRKT